MGRTFLDSRTGWWIADWFDSAGERHRKKVSRNAAEAKEMLALLEGQSLRERYLDLKPLKKVRFGEYADVFLEHARANMRAWRRYLSSLQSLRLFFGNKVMTAIDTASIEKYKLARIRDVQAATVNRDLQCLRRMFNLAVAWGYLRESPFRFVKLFREKAGRLRYLTREEYGRLLPACPDHLRPIVEVAAHSGMRQGELLALRWADVDLENGFASVNDPKNATPRKVPLNETAQAVLAALRLQSKGQWVFCEADGRRYATRTLQRHFPAALAAAGITEFRFHDLRHTCASWMAMAGVPILTIKEVLGHKDIRMTLRYAHLTPDQRVDAVKRLDTFVQSKPATDPPAGNDNGKPHVLEMGHKDGT